MKIEVTRGFFLAGQPLAAGAVVDVPDALGIELVALGKAVQATDAVARPAPRRKAKEEAAE